MWKSKWITFGRSLCILRTIEKSKQTASLISLIFVKCESREVTQIYYFPHITRLIEPGDIFTVIFLKPYFSIFNVCAWFLQIRNKNFNHTIHDTNLMTWIGFNTLGISEINSNQSYFCYRSLSIFKWFVVVVNYFTNWWYNMFVLLNFLIN